MTATEPATAPPTVTGWLRRRATAGAVGNVVVFTLLAATAASRAAHGVLSPAGLVAVVAGAAAAATSTGWVAGFYDGAEAALRSQVVGVRAGRGDGLAGRRPWRSALRWVGWSALWSASGAIVLAAILERHSAPFVVVAAALLTLAVPAAVIVDVAARAAGAATGAALLAGRPDTTPLLRRAWGELALPAAAVQVVVNAGAAWMLFHGASAEGTLTKDAALADVLVVAGLLAALFGSLGARWGSVDAAAGRVVVAAPEGGRSHPVGAQALVYAAGLTILVASLAGLVVPASPSILRVALVRGALAGGLTLVAVALGVVRGALNTEPLALPTVRPPLVAAAGLPQRPPARRLARLAGAGAATAVVALAALPLVPAPSAQAAPLEGLGLVAELDALGVRVEYDIPAPASSGSIPQVVGTARRSAGSDSANGIAASPSRLDPVVGGTVTNADKEPGSGDEIALPQAECAYPGALADIAFTFPTDLRPDTAGTPPLGWSTAQCSAGPTVELHATGVSPDRVSGLGAAVSVGAAVADASAGPVQGVLGASASAQASGVSILGGLITVDGIRASGSSHTDGTPGGASTTATVDLIGVEVAGVRFDLRGGDLVVDGTTLPVGGSAASALLRSISAALAPSRCALTILDSPAAYPQGFLFARPEPELGVAADGTLAASMTGGLLVQCEIPEEIGTTTGFNPQRMQVALGFVYTSVSAREDIGGFGLGDLGGGTDQGGSGGGLAAPTAGGFTGSGGAPIVAPPAASSPPAGPDGPSAPAAPDGPAGSITERIELLAANFAADRPWLWLAALVVWLVLTHRGLERARGLVAEAVA